MAETDITITGLWYLNGITVTCAIAGLDCGDYRVSNSVIVVPIDANPQLADGAYLALVAAKNLDAPNMCFVALGDVVYTLPVVVGRKFTTKGQALRPILAPTEPGLGKRKRGQQYSFLFSDAAMGQLTVGEGRLAAGTSFSALYPINLRQADEFTTGSDTVKYQGVHWDALNDQASFDTMLCWQVARPVPLSISAHAVHLHFEDR